MAVSIFSRPYDLPRKKRGKKEERK